MRYSIKHFPRLAVFTLILALCLSVAALAEPEPAPEPDPEPDYSTLTLGEDGTYRNSQGVIFTLSRDTNMASVGTGSTTANNAGYEGANDGNLVIPDTVTYNGQTYQVNFIRRNAFCDNDNLKTVTLGKYVTTIASAAELDRELGIVSAPFSNCPNLTKFIVDPESNSFSTKDDVLYDKFAEHMICMPGGKSLAKFVVPDGVTHIETGTFCGCTGIKEVVINGSEVPVIVKNFSFSGDKGIVKLTISGNVEKIGMGAFQNCASLKTVSISGSVEEIDYHAFQNCASLETVTINTSVDSAMNNLVFADCPALVSVDINGGVKTIGSAVFKNCAVLKTLYIYSGVESMGYYPLVGCVSLQKLTLPFLGTTPEKGCFFGNLFFSDGYNNYPETIIDRNDGNEIVSRLNTYAPETLKDVGIAGGKLYKKAFRKCVHIESIALGRSITAIPSSIFVGCTSLKKFDFGISKVFTKTNLAEDGIVRILPHIESIGMWAFYDCPLIAAFDVDENNTAYASDYFGVLYDKDFKLLICYPPACECAYYCVKGSAEEIEQYSFCQYCTFLATVNIPNSNTRLTKDNSSASNCFDRSLTAWIVVHKDSMAEKALKDTSAQVWTIDDPKKPSKPTRIYIQRLPDLLGLVTGSDPEFVNLQIIVQYPTNGGCLLLDPLDYDVSFSGDTTGQGACTANIVYKQDYKFAVQFNVFFFAKQSGYVVKEFPMRSSLAGALDDLKDPCFITALYDSKGKMTNMCLGAVIDNTEQWNSLRYSVYMPKALADKVDAEGAVSTSDTIKTFILDGMVPLCEPGSTLIPPLENLIPIK